VVEQAHPGIGPALRISRPRIGPRPETGDFGGQPAFSGKDLLRDFQDLFNRMRAVGEDAVGWMTSREVSKWMMMGLVIGVVIGVARRELRHTAAGTQGAEGEGNEEPWLGFDLP